MSKLIYKLWLLSQSRKYQKLHCQHCDMKNNCTKKWAAKVCTYPYQIKVSK